MLGLGAKGQTAQNLMRERECVLNLPSAAMVAAVNRLAKLTGSDPVPPHKVAMGYRTERNKFPVAGLTQMASVEVRPPRVAECPVQLEAVFEQAYPFGHRPDKQPGAMAFEVRVVRAHFDPAILMEGEENRIDPDKWRPLIMSFCQFYGLGERLHYSTLAEIPEVRYRPAEHISR
jgi:flavin reductase (DIM6/NTAB) family NADH-FMN oxidoreductase RutF